MNKTIAIDIFIKTNFNFLENNEVFDKKEFEKIKKAYFGQQLKYQFSIPKDKELVDVFVNKLIKFRNIDDFELFKKKCKDIRFLKYFVQDPTIYKNQLVELKKDIELLNATSNLGRLEKIEKLKEFAIEQVSPELLKREKEIEEQIKKREEDYKRLPSILDELEIDEPEENLYKETIKEWWEELNLKENPFPNFNGFSRIAKEVYKEIIVETEPIRWFLNKIERNSNDIFGKALLLYGDFGSGKSTLYDYISPILSFKKIPNFRITLTENTSELPVLINSLEKKFCYEILKLSKSYNFSNNYDIKELLDAKILMLDILDKGEDGFLVLIDDLHKHNNKNLVFQFLSHLQIIIDEFNRDDINLAFLVSGLPDWKDKILQDLGLRGFFYVADELGLPEITPEIASAAITKRLKAFSLNPEQEISIKVDFLRVVLSKIKQSEKRIKVGFRQYMQEAVINFQNKKFDILSLDFSKIDAKLGNRIKDDLEQIFDFKYGINKIVYGGIRKKENVELSLKVLCEIYLRKGVAETDKFFNENVFFFKRLEEILFIQKFRKDNKLFWKVSPFLNDLNQTIIAKYNLSIENYLVPIYSPALSIESKMKKIVTQDEYLKDIANFETIIDRNLVDLLKNSYKVYKTKIEIYFADENLKKVNEIGERDIRQIKLCIWELMKAIIKFESPALLDIHGESGMETWHYRYSSSETIDELLHNFNEFEISHANIHKTRILQLAKEAFDELWKEFKSSIEFNHLTNLKNYNLSKKTNERLFKYYKNLLNTSLSSEKYFDNFKLLIEEIENATRLYLLTSSLVTFGLYDKRFKILPDNIKNYIAGKSLPHVTYECLNEFQNLNRGQYRNIFLETDNSNPFFKIICSKVLNSWSSEDKKLFFKQFGDFNIIVSHQKIQEIENVKPEIVTFFKLACRFLSDLSASLLNLISVNYTIIEDGPNNISQIFYGYLVNDKKSRTILKKIEDSKSFEIPNYLNLVDLKPLENNKMKDFKSLILNSGGILELDLSNIEEVRTISNLNFLEVIPILSYLLYKNEVRIIKIYGTNLILKLA